MKKTKQKLMNFQVTDEQRSLIVSKAKSQGLTASAYLRNRALESPTGGPPVFNAGNPKGGKIGSTKMQRQFDQMIVPITQGLFSAFINNPASPVRRLLERGNMGREKPKDLDTDLAFVVGELIEVADAIAAEISEAREYYVEEDQFFDENGRSCRDGIQS